MNSSLPLSLDIGATRLRMAYAERQDGGVKIQRIAVRELPGGAASSGHIVHGAFVAAIIDDARAELNVRERRCVCAIGAPDAFLHAIAFPKMTWIERDRAARFEVARYLDFPIDEALVRMQNVDPGRGIYAVGAARTAALKSRVAALRQAGLRPLAVDHESSALARALEGFDAIVDVGFERSCIHACTAGSVPYTVTVASGGRSVTQSIARELGIDERSAERRKRIVGTAGAGESQTYLARQVAGAIESLRRRVAVHTTALVGNGARTKGLAAAIEAAANVRVTIPICAALRGNAFADDVLRASAADWNLVAGIALWSAAR